MLIHGSCHCGNIKFDLAWEPDPSEIPARACSCSFCVKHGGAWTSNPAGSLSVTIRAPDHVSRYTFGTATAIFHVCADCGVVPLVTCAIDERVYAVVTVNAFTNVASALLRRKSTSFDDENVESRLARRKRNWIADVRFVDAAGRAALE
jgi:hypothetical protein